MKELDDNYKWIARNYNGALITFTSKPTKNPNLYWDSFGERMDDRLFQFIQWEDEEPYNIAELIEEYESEETEVKNNKLNGKTLNKILTEYFDERAPSDDDAKIILDYHKFDDATLIELALGVVGLAWGTSGRKVVDILDDFDQPDEPEVLSQEWIDKKRLINRVENYIPLHNKTVGDVINGVLEIIKQLPEFEVLSPEWIDEHAKAVTYDGIPDQTEIVYVDDLQNLLVPMQELPVIPQFVAEWISKHHERFDLYPALKRLENNALSWEDVYEWYRRNTYIFVNAYLTGKYEVEVEEKQKYYVLDKDNIIMIGKVNNGKVMKRNFHTPFNNFSESAKEKAQLTEQEIKDYDERYWPFAKEVTE